MRQEAIQAHDGRNHKGLYHVEIKTMAEIYCQDGTSQEIQSAINSASPEDEVIMPPGNWEFDFGVRNYVPLIIKGAGREETIISKSPLYTNNDCMVRFDYSGDAPIRVHDFKIIGKNDRQTRDQGLGIVGAFTNVRAHHLEVVGFGYGGIIPRYNNGLARMLIDHCNIIDCYRQGYGYGVSVIGSETDSWDAPWIPGGADNIFIEDCYFEGCRHAIAGNAGARYVCRYSLFEDNQPGEHTIDAHGDPIGHLDMTHRGTRSYEIYHNIINGQDCNGVGIRGGDGVIFNNIMGAGISAYPIFLTQDNLVDCQGCGGYPCKDQIRELYIWGNTKGGVPIDHIGDGAFNVRLTKSGIEDIIQEGRDVFLYERPEYMPFIYPHPLRNGGEIIMNKAELLQKLSQRFYRVETPELKMDYTWQKYYLVKIWDVDGDVKREGNIAFCVENEGQANEVAHWAGSEPKPEKTDFRQELIDFIKARVDDESIEGAFIEESDPINETATAKVIMNSLAEQRYFIDRDGNGKLQYRQIA